MTSLIVLCISYIFSQFFRSFLSVLTPALSNELGMTATDFAYASGAWFVTFALFQFPVGSLLDSIGPRRTAGFIFTSLTGSGILLFGLSSNPLMIIVAMGMIGAGCSTALMAPVYIIVREFDARKFATLVSIFIGIGSLGNIASSEPLAAAVQAFGWRECSYFLAAGSIAVGLAIMLLVKDPQSSEKHIRHENILDLLKIRELWLIFPIISCGYVVAAGLRGSWIGPLHSDLYGYDTLQIGRASLFLSVALVLGTLFYGPLDRIFNSRKRIILAGNMVVLCLCVFMALTIPEQAWVSTLIIALAGFFGASYAVQMAHGKSFIPPHLTGRGVTLLNFCSMGGAGIFQWIAGPVVELGSTPQYPQSGYQVLFLYYAMLTIIAISLYSFSKDAKPEQSTSQV